MVSFLNGYICPSIATPVCTDESPVILASNNNRKDLCEDSVVRYVDALGAPLGLPPNDCPTIVWFITFQCDPILPFHPSRVVPLNSFLEEFDSELGSFMEEDHDLEEDDSSAWILIG